MPLLLLTFGGGGNVCTHSCMWLAASFLVFRASPSRTLPCMASRATPFPDAHYFTSLQLSFLFCLKCPLLPPEIVFLAQIPLPLCSFSNLGGRNGLSFWGRYQCPALVSIDFSPRALGGTTWSNLLLADSWLPGAETLPDASTVPGVGQWLAGAWPVSAGWKGPTGWAGSPPGPPQWLTDKRGQILLLAELLLLGLIMFQCWVSFSPILSPVPKGCLRLANPAF